MNSKAQFALIAVIGLLAIGLIVSKGLWSKEVPQTVDPAAVARMQERLLELERRQEPMKADLEELARKLDSLSRERIAGAPVETAAAADALASGETPGDPKRGAGAAASRGTEPLTVASAMAQLTDPKMSWDDREAIWKKVRAAGLLDQVITEFEKRAAANPKDAAVQTELGEAYLKKIEEVGQGPEAGKWAMKADQSFDRALEIDPEHWEARFVKAMSLSFWPPVFGKQTEAIKHFETLVGQQERQAPQSGFDDTYLMLGNMYQQIGQRDRAIETWNRGLKLFPDNAELRQQISNAR
jgi:tetratricopeptide (TPR) repeat protein